VLGDIPRRVSGGIEVTLYWSAHDNTTCVEVSQPASEDVVLFSVPRERALAAFYHPFSYLPISARPGEDAIGRVVFS